MVEKVSKKKDKKPKEAKEFKSDKNIWTEGTVKSRTAERPKSAPPTTKSAPPTTKSAPPTTDVKEKSKTFKKKFLILKEIQSLGGDSTDFDLIKNVLSDDEKDLESDEEKEENVENKSEIKLDQEKLEFGRFSRYLSCCLSVFPLFILLSPETLAIILCTKLGNQI